MDGFDLWNRTVFLREHSARCDSGFDLQSVAAGITGLGPVYHGIRCFVHVYLRPVSVDNRPAG